MAPCDGAVSDTAWPGLAWTRIGLILRFPDPGILGELPLTKCVRVGPGHPRIIGPSPRQPPREHSLVSQGTAWREAETGHSSR